MWNWSTSRVGAHHRVHTLTNFGVKLVIDMHVDFYFMGCSTRLFYFCIALNDIANFNWCVKYNIVCSFRDIIIRFTDSSCCLVHLTHNKSTKYFTLRITIAGHRHNLKHKFHAQLSCSSFPKMYTVIMFFSVWGFLIITLSHFVYLSPITIIFPTAPSWIERLNWT